MGAHLHKQDSLFGQSSLISRETTNPLQCGVLIGVILQSLPLFGAVLCIMETTKLMASVFAPATVGAASISAFSVSSAMPLSPRCRPASRHGSNAMLFTQAIPRE